jgi:hypothetical protein
MLLGRRTSAEAAEVFGDEAVLDDFLAHSSF